MIHLVQRPGRSMVAVFLALLPMTSGCQPSNLSLSRPECVQIKVSSPAVYPIIARQIRAVSRWTPTNHDGREECEPTVFLAAISSPITREYVNRMRGEKTVGNVVSMALKHPATGQLWGSLGGSDDFENSIRRGTEELLQQVNR